MDLNDGLRDSLKAYLGWGKPRLDCFVSMLLALIPRQFSAILRALQVHNRMEALQLVARMGALSTA